MVSRLLGVREEWTSRCANSTCLRLPPCSRSEERTRDVKKSSCERSLLLALEFKMQHVTHQVHKQADDPHAGHKMSEAHATHDRHAGHSVAMFRDKFWLSFAL